ncbi:hypothetical protein EDD29_0040 [Actinocorallia herbida]|uniref:DUF6292 domain-containing protein n=1 Tax=Actinocorallia herbida TaxID=58109 RepID=A0A3N1CMM7_9ACTN|nr:DUF6292 family protein [Actinocorallia herbida]ROO82560.1 hypothetical protein EDD29_0040 [Actinocorallia herbida]
MSDYAGPATITTPDGTTINVALDIRDHTGLPVPSWSGHATDLPQDGARRLADADILTFTLPDGRSGQGYITELHLEAETASARIRGAGGKLFTGSAGQSIEDQVDAITKAAGKDYYSLPELYMAAVADALDRAGVSVASHWANPDDPRNGAIELAVPAPYEERHVAWSETDGWGYIPTTDTTKGGDRFEVLPVDLLALPEDVVAAAMARLTRDKEPRPAAAWTPPDDYTTAPFSQEEYCLELERGLAAYATHPANQP